MSFTLGINLPWVDGEYDHDFGYNATRNPHIDYEPNPTFSKTNFDRYIKDISEMGASVVRLWLFERFEGLEFSNSGAVTKYTDDILTNIQDACKIASDHNIKFYFCLMDTWGILKKDLVNAKGDPRKKYAAQINGLITTKPKRDSFLNAVCNFLSDDVIKESVWAVDVLNEPDGIQKEYTMTDKNRGEIDTGISFDQLVKYITDACDTIRSKTGHKVSCGIRKEVFNQFANKIKNHVDFFDIHHYDDEGNLPSITHLQKECIVGECGKKDRENRDDEKQKKAIGKFLRNAKNQGYSGCFVWEYGSTKKNEPLALINSDETHRSPVQEIKEFSRELYSC